MSKSKRLHAHGLALVAFAIASAFCAGFASPANAFEFHCGRGTCSIDLNLHGASPTLQLVSTDARFGGQILGIGATVLGDLTQPSASLTRCHRSNGSSLCLLQTPQPNHGGLHAFRTPVRRNRVHPRPPTNPIPEPSAALIFGAGILVASGLVMKTGDLE